MSNPTTPLTPVAEGDEELHEWCIRLAREMRGSAEDADAVACRVGLANPQEWRAIAASRHQAAERYERIASALHALDAVRRERDDFRAELNLLGSEVDTLTRERDEAVKDSTRLDCLEAMANELGGILLHDGSESGRRGIGLRPGLLKRTLREAIDAALGSSGSAASNEARQPEDCPKCLGRGRLPIPGQNIPCDHVVTPQRPATGGG
jgi:hypothetical protein